MNDDIKNTGNIHGVKKDRPTPANSADDQFRVLAENAGSLIFVAREGRYIYVNPAFIRIVGYTAEELYQMYMWEIVAPEQQQLIKERVMAREAGEEVPAQYEIIIVHKDGEARWIDYSGAFIYYEGRPAVLGSGIDISERKRAEESWRESELLYRTIFATTGTAMMIFGEDMLIYLVNCQFEQLSGYSKAEIENQKKWPEFIAEDDLPRMKEYHRKRRIDAALVPANYEFKLVQRSGKIRDIFITVNIIPGTKNSVVSFMDITERKKAETDRERYKEELFQEKEVLRTTLLSIGDGVLTTDRQGRISSLNRVGEQLTGWTQEEARGKPLAEVFQIINEFTRERIDNPVDEVLKTGNIMELANHTILISKDGVERPVEDSAAPIKDEDGKINGVVLIFRDFTDKKAKLAEIEYLSYHDQLTGLYNRRFFDEELKRLDTERNLPLSLVMGDINGLKLTNDAFGHQAGDKLLQTVARVIKNECRADDIIARVGGDEFVILLPKTETKEARIIVQRINEALIYENTGAAPLSISFGWDTKRSKTEKMAAVYKKAEDFMYRRKLSESASLRNETVKVIIKTLFEKNEREQQHSSRVSELCEALGKALELNPEDIRELKTVGLMHDIGKIILDDRILDKEGELLDAEIAEIRRHSETGYRILGSVNEYAQLAEYVLAHHERWDGKGYPKKLEGPAIPLQARIIAVTDAYDAMTSDRPYRKALSEDAAIEEIKRNAGTQFNPEIARVFLEKVLGKAWD